MGLRGLAVHACVLVEWFGDGYVYANGGKRYGDEMNQKQIAPIAMLKMQSFCLVFFFFFFFFF